MNENLDLVEILKDCPRGTKLYSTINGEVTFDCVDNNKGYPIVVDCTYGPIRYTRNGRFDKRCDGECILFPSKDQRDWNKFIITWRDKFDPQTLKPVDQVLAKTNDVWYFDFFQKYVQEDVEFPYHCLKTNTNTCIPYNDDTKHLVGTTKEAPEYYRYWEE